MKVQTTAFAITGRRQTVFVLTKKHNAFYSHMRPLHSTGRQLIPDLDSPWQERWNEYKNSVLGLPLESQMSCKDLSIRQSRRIHRRRSVSAGHASSLLLARSRSHPSTAPRNNKTEQWRPAITNRHTWCFCTRRVVYLRTIMHLYVIHS